MKLRALAVLVVILIAPSQGWAVDVLDLRTEYAAASTVGTGAAQRHGRLWRTPLALRHETVDGSRPITVIARLDRKVAWLLVPEQKLAVEMGLDNLGLPGALLSGAGVTQTPLGDEVMAGRRTTRVRVERAATDGTTHFSGLVWTTPEGIIMKIAGTGETQGRKGSLDMSFSEVRVGRQDPALFELPDGFRRLALTGVDFETLLAGVEQLRQLGQGKGSKTAPAQ